MTHTADRTPGFARVAAARTSRRRLLKGLVALAAVQVLGGRALAAQRRAHRLPTGGVSTLAFSEVPRGRDTKLHVPEGYEAEVLIRWGDPVEKGAPPFDPHRQTVAAQKKQFGYNCDYVGLVPLPATRRGTNRYALGVNHEYTRARDMLPGLGEKAARAKMSREQVDIQLAAIGFSVVEVEETKEGWRTLPGAPLNRRINFLDTPHRIAGPAAGSDRMKTATDPSGTLVLGTGANCAGGTTPWGTFLTCEENFHDYFGGKLENEEHPEARNHARYLVGGGRGPLQKLHPRFDISAEAREANRFGWVVEIDPRRPDAAPVKRTALGRFAHEAASVSLSPDGRVVVYSGDDRKGEYLYRFVSQGRYDPKNREANSHLLDDGVLSVARFEEQGRVIWLPLVQGQGGLTEAAGFRDQADVLVETRRAADIVGATPMDRPEDVEENPATGLVYVMLTNNDERGTKFPLDAANERAKNIHGQVLEIHPPIRRGRRDHTADEMQWEMFLKGGDPRDTAQGADYQKTLVTEDGWLSCPDNCTFDGGGRLWISTDGGHMGADGVYACDTLGPGRALTRHFLRAPVGAEVCGPLFAPDDRSFFVAIQHPGSGKKTHFEKPSTRWPDFDSACPPRASVVVVRRRDGGRIGD
jgi:uncharacterized protein